MTVEQIENFLAKETIPQGKIIRFELKKRDPVRGIIVQGRDYQELKAKNFWRIVTQKKTCLHIKSQMISASQGYLLVLILPSFRWYRTNQKSNQISQEALSFASSNGAPVPLR